MLIVSITILKGVLQFELISDSDHDLQPDSDSIDDVSSNRLCSQSRVEPVRKKSVAPRRCAVPRQCVCVIPVSKG